MKWRPFSKGLESAPVHLGQERLAPNDPFHVTDLALDDAATTGIAR
jgi:hypothetical protein